MLRRLLQGTDAAAHGEGDHSIQEERARSRSVLVSVRSACYLAHTPPLLPSHAPVLPLQRLSQTDGGRSLRSLINTPLMFIKQLPADYSRWVWEECSGLTQDCEITYDEANSKRLYWLDVFRILTLPPFKL